MSVSSYVTGAVLGVSAAVAAVFGAPEVLKSILASAPRDTVIIVCDRNELATLSGDVSAPIALSACRTAESPNAAPYAIIVPQISAGS